MKFFQFNKTDREETDEKAQKATKKDSEIQTLSEGDLDGVVGGVGPMVVFSSEDAKAS